MYHVTLRGNHRQDIFFAPDDRHRLSGLFAEATQRFDARVHAYCYMSNHIHALVQVGDVPLGRLILHVAGRYARCTQGACKLPDTCSKSVTTPFWWMSTNTSSRYFATFT
jgi:REP element-mobilizing transposase RayT